MKDEKKKKFIQVFAIALIMLLIASASYAYFAARVSEASSTDIIVNTSTVDNLTFETGEAISISATQSNFTEGSGNQTGSTYASATLVANNDTNEASANYYLYIKIDTNEFEYTTSDKTAELILTITDPDGNEVTSLSGLTYTSVTDGDGNTVSGFDITSKIGLITIASDYLIESAGTNTQEWNIEVTLVNLDSNQSDNAGKSFSASLIIQSNVYGNTLQVVGSWDYSEKMWAYKDSITKIVFDDSGSIIDTYEVVYDITDYSSYCTFDGNEVYNFDNWSTDGVTESSCNTVYKVTDDDYTVYFDSTIGDNFTSPLSVSWDSNEGVCVIDDLNSGTYYLYTWYYGNNPTEEQCTGYAYSYQDNEYYYLGIESVGSGEWEETENYSSIQAYLVDNGDDTYTVYIESDAPILANENMCYWFLLFSSLESIEGLEKLITSNVITMVGMFAYCDSLTSLNLSNFDTSSVKYFGDGYEGDGMFFNCKSLISLDLSSFDTSNSIDMSFMFCGCSSLISLDLSSFDTTNVENIEYMFANCSGLTSLNVSGFTTSNVKNMGAMFSGCSSLISLDLNNFDTTNVTDFRYMFEGCSNLISLDLSNFDTSTVENMKGMFYYCTNLTSLDMSNADFTNVTSYEYMFRYANSSITVTVKDSTAQTFIQARLKEYNGGTVVIA